MVSIPIPIEVPNCPLCGEKMQVAETYSGDDKLLAVRFIHGCVTPPFQVNWHAGQQPSTR